MCGHRVTGGKIILELPIHCWPMAASSTNFLLYSIFESSWGAMKKFIVAGIAVAAFCGAPAIAADMPTKGPVYKAADPLFNWSGLYVGLNGGYQSGKNCWTDVGPGATPRGFAVPANEGCNTSGSWLGGGQVGYNFQSNATVFGVEVAGDWIRKRSGRFAILDTLGFDRSKLHDLDSLTGRVGTAWQNALFYVKGGAGHMNQDYAIAVGGIGGPIRSSGSEDRWGWTAGLGAEFALTKNLSAAIEYDYYGFGKRNVSLFDGTGALDVIESISQHYNVITLRLNYRFGDPGWGKGPVVAKY